MKQKSVEFFVYMYYYILANQKINQKVLIRNNIKTCKENKRETRNIINGKHSLTGTFKKRIPTLKRL
jgi:hypothetical protein